MHAYSDIGTYGGSPTNFTMGPMTAPLEELGLKGDTVIVDGLEFKKPRQDVDTHFYGLAQLLTGPFPTPGADFFIDCKPKNQSINRYLASKIGAGLNWPQLNMATMSDSVTYSFTPQLAPVPSNRSPLDIYTKVFGGLTTTGPDPAMVRRLARRQSVLDTVTGDLTAFQKRLGTEDRARAEAQLATIRAMEQRLEAGAKPSACQKPGAPASGIDYTKAQFVPEAMRAFIDLAVAAMACDQTRVVLMHAYIRHYFGPGITLPFAPVNQPNYSLHALSHDDPGDNWASFIKAKAFHYRLAGELANKLKAIPENGKTMLDNTIIFIPTEIGAGHENTNLQFVTIGGKGLGVKTGQYLKLGQRGIGKGVAHQRLLVSLLQAMGLPDQTYGDEPGTGTGPLPGFAV